MNKYCLLLVGYQSCFCQYSEKKSVYQCKTWWRVRLVIAVSDGRERESCPCPAGVHRGHCARASKPHWLVVFLEWAFLAGAGQFWKMYIAWVITAADTLSYSSRHECLPEEMLLGPLTKESNATFSLASSVNSQKTDTSFWKCHWQFTSAISFSCRKTFRKIVIIWRHQQYCW